MGDVLDWQNLTGSKIAALDPAKTVVVVSCSPLEVHGPHLPTAADMCEAEGLFTSALAILAKNHEDVTFVRLPPVYVAADVLPHRGSLKFSPKAVTTVLEELGSTLARQGFKNLWVGNFHGGPRHILAIERACHRVNKKFDARMISVFSLLAKKLTGGSSDLATRLDGVGGISKADLKGDNHGGVVETAMLLHLVGEHVDAGYKDLPARSIELELAEQKRAPLQKGSKPTILEIIRSLPLRQRYYERETYAGIPGRASQELGREYLKLLADETASSLADLLDGKIGPDDCYSPLWPMRHVFLNDTFGWIFERAVRSRPSPI